MQFSRLRLSGFKSFVDPAELPILPGLTGIVGPNGCGKSNLLEALRWVMGETSAKSLRGGGMDDVIFNGTGRRPARNLAEVSLLLDQVLQPLDGAVPPDGQVEVSRRIERAAGSAYRMNGRDMRAQDVKLLFADGATGAHSPSLVSQGRIGALVTAKPAERRAILEEAAGISGLHSRRSDAEKKLRAAETNLARVQDILQQLDGRISQLKRQAGQAKRYRELCTAITQAQAADQYMRWKQAAEAVLEQEKALAEAVRAVAEHEHLLLAAQKAEEESQSALPTLRGTEAEAQAVLQRLSHEQEALHAQEQRRIQALETAERALAQAIQDLAHAGELASDADQALTRLTQEQDRLTQISAASAQDLAQAKADLSAKAQTASEAEQCYDGLNGQYLNAKARAASLNGDLSALERKADRLVREQAELDQRIAQFGQSASPDLAQAETAVTQAQANAHTAEEDYAGAGNVTQQARTDEQEAKQALDMARQTLTRLEAEIAALQAVAGGAGEASHAPILAKLTVPQGLEQALGAAFGATLEAGEDTDAPLFWISASPQAGDPALPEGATPVSQLVGGPPTLARALAQIGLVDDDTMGEALASSLATGQILVTRTGRLWRWDGYGQRADAPAPAAVRLHQQSKLQTLGEERRQAFLAVEEAEQVWQSTHQSTQTAAQAEAKARQARKTADETLAHARSALAEAERENAKQASLAASLEAQKDRLTRDSADTQKSLTEVRTALAALPDRTALETQVNTQRTHVEEARRNLADARARTDTLARDQEMRERRLTDIAQERTQWTDRQTKSAERQHALNDRVTEQKAEIDRLTADPAAHEAKLHALSDRMTEGQKALTAARDALAEADTAHRATLAALKHAEAQIATAREARVRLETLHENALAKRKELAAACGEAFRCPPPDLPAKLDFAAEDARLLADAQEKLIRDRDRLGAVNLQAAEELEETQAERDRLAADRADLEQAIARLRGAIGALNREGRERLLAAFTQVNQHFTDLFTHLFGGGQAHLALVDSDDPLEAGLEIMASPPGKRLQALSLLSGGEQALTALALIFAVFLTNPAPICVLDEVDAPLDDANVDRFCDLLDDMMARTQTRFLIVTHNAVTMARMQRLFGVTMAERGVSSLVSVDLGQAENLREAAPIIA